MALHAACIVAYKNMGLEFRRNLFPLLKHFYNFFKEPDLFGKMAITLEVLFESGSGLDNHSSSDLQKASNEEVSTGGKSLPRRASSIAAIVTALG